MTLLVFFFVFQRKIVGWLVCFLGMFNFCEGGCEVVWFWYEGTYGFFRMRLLVSVLR